MEPIRGEVHPLQNQVILDIIFNGLSLAELKECRQVCKEWLVAASKAMKGSAKVVARLSKFLPVVDNGLSTFTTCPFADTFALFLGNSAVSSKFWERCGSHIKSLEMWEVIFSSAEDFYQAILVSCPKLEVLMLLHCRIQGLEDLSQASAFPELEGRGNESLKSLDFCEFNSEGSLISWTKFFSHCPSLKVLNVEGYSESDDLFRSLGVVRRADERTCNLNLLGFDFDDINGRHDILGLLNACPALDTLEIHGFRVRRDVASLQAILKTCAGTLKSLSLHTSGDFMAIQMETGDVLKLPNNGTFRQLQELKLYYPHMLSMNFLRTFPTLRKLVLTLLDHSMLKNTRDMEEMRGFVLPTCTELELYPENSFPDGPEEFDVEHVQMLGAWLPNLEKLKIKQLRSEMFTLICEQWPNLTSLRSLWGRLDDSAFTGLDLLDVQRINEEGRTRDWRPVTVPRANITSLKSLEVLSLSLAAWGIEGGTLGYSSAVCGIQHLANLKQLRLIGFQENRDGEIWGPYLAKFPWKIREHY